MLTWGVSWPSAKILSRYGTPVEIAFLRFIFTFFGVFAILKFSHIPVRINKQGYRPLLMASILMAAYSLLFFTGLKKGLAGAGGVLVTTTTPLVTFLMAAIFSNRKLITREWLGLGIGIIGGCFLLSIWSKYDQILASGNLFFFGSTIVWAILTRFTARASDYGAAPAFSLWMYLVCIIILAFFQNQHLWEVLKKGDGLFWFNMIFNAVINTGMATTFYFYATSKLGPEKTSTFIYIVPFAAAFSSLVILKETLAWNTIVGGILGIAAVWVINRRK
jgi:drug/metabolite transporter (DMT)-like permease